MAEKRSSSMSLPEDEQLEALNCIGGPLHAKRLSFPAGLQWFTFAKDQLDIREAMTEHGIIDFGGIKGIADSSTTVDWDQNTDPVCAYVRKTFVTGEAGLGHTFVYQE